MQRDAAVTETLVAVCLVIIYPLLVDCHRCNDALCCPDTGHEEHSHIPPRIAAILHTQCPLAIINIASKPLNVVMNKSVLDKI